MKTHNFSCKNEKSQTMSGIDLSVEKIGSWSDLRVQEYVVMRLIPQNTGTYPRTAFY